MHMPHRAVQNGEIAARMDALPLNCLHVALFSVLGLGLLFDQMEGSMSAILTAVFSEPSSPVSRSALSTMLTAYYVVAAIGAPIMGMVADRIGRRAALAGTLFCFGSLTILSALAGDFLGFAVLRVASSFALSAVPPLVFSYLADVLPPYARGSLMMLAGILSGVGAAMAAFLTHWGNDLQPFGLHGWQAAMLIGAAAGIALGLAMVLMPDSPRWLSARGYGVPAQSTLRRFERSRPLFSKPRLKTGEETDVSLVSSAGSSAAGGSKSKTGGLLVLIVIVMLLQSAGLTGFALLLTKALVLKGFAMQAALARSGVILLAMPVGVVFAALVTDRMERRRLFLAMSLALAVSAAAFGALDGEIPVMATGLIFGFFMTAHSALLQIYCSELFPTGLRGTAMGMGYAGIRVGSSCVPLILLPMLLDHGPATAFAAIAACLLASGLAVRVFCPAIYPRENLARRA